MVYVCSLRTLAGWLGTSVRVVAWVASSLVAVLAGPGCAVAVFCERSYGGVRWKLYLPMNDPARNIVSHYQAISQQSNVDFQPLIDHFSAIEYITKYATKAEKGS